MVEITITNGQIVFIDNEDFDLISKYKWYRHKGGNTWYARTHVKMPDGTRKGLFMHQLILGFPLCHIDHKDGNGLNNQKHNIRLCTHQENHMNQRKRKYTSSKYKGVSWHKRGRKWGGSIQANCTQIGLGFCVDESIIAKRYDMAAIFYFGEFARLNFPIEEYF